MAKCYFAKHKLVWEVLEGGLKSKIEIQWSDIMALKANCPDDGPGTLNVVVWINFFFSCAGLHSGVSMSFYSHSVRPMWHHIRICIQ